MDDNLELRDFLVSVLTESGVDAVAATSAEDAVAHFNQERYDGFVVDSTLGDIDGVALAERVRAAKFGKGVPVLLMSAITTSLARRIAQSAGCQFIAKPFGMTEFVEQVRALR